MDFDYPSIIKKILFLTVNFVSFPCVYFFQLSKGLDPSWAFALNYIHNTGAKFGEDHFFTYGPLGFLGRCQSVGNNLYLGILFWIVVTVMQAYLYKCLFTYADSLILAALACVLVVFAFPVGEADIHLCFLTLAALLLVYKYEDFYSRWIAVFFCGVIFLFKFSGAILLAATLFFMILCAAVQKKPVKTVGFLFGCILIGPACYLVYHPSVRSLFRYVRAAAEISLGYNQAMSLDVYDAYYVWVIVLVLCYVFLLFYAILNQKKGWDCFLILSPACFFWYKEGFVRNDGHHLLAVAGLLLVCTLLLFFADLGEWLGVSVQNTWSKAAACCFCVMVLLPVMGSGKTGAGALQAASANLFQMPKVIDDCCTQKRSELQEHNKQFIAVIADGAYTTFPWEITENISYDNANFKIAPLLQNYTVYTPYLDRLNAAFYAGSDAPEYVILDLYTIDGRFPLVEAPATWKKIYQNYCVAASEGERFLLKKREKPLQKELIETGRVMCGLDDYIEIPQDCTFVKLEAKQGLKGRLENLFYKTLPVSMEVTYQDGTKKAGRVILNNLQDGIDIRALALDGSTFQKYMDADAGKQDFLCGGGCAGIALTGQGVRSYADTMEVTFYSGGWK